MLVYLRTNHHTSHSRKFVRGDKTTERYIPMIRQESVSMETTQGRKKKRSSCNTIFQNVIVFWSLQQSHSPWCLPSHAPPAKFLPFSHTTYLLRTRHQVVCLFRRLLASSSASSRLRLTSSPLWRRLFVIDKTISSLLFKKRTKNDVQYVSEKTNEATFV